MISKKGLIYARVSSPKQDDGLSKESQIDLNTKVCARCQLEIDGTKDKVCCKNNEKPEIKYYKECKWYVTTDVIIVTSFDSTSSEMYFPLLKLLNYFAQRILNYGHYTKDTIFTPPKVK